MTDNPLTDTELDHLRNGGPPLGDPCWGCGSLPELHSDRLPHYYHEPGCPKVADLRRERGLEC